MPLPDEQGAPIECDAKCTIYHKGAGKDHNPLNGSILKGSRTYPGQQAAEPSAYREDGTPNTDWTNSRAPELMNMDLGAISARINAPNDGKGAGGTPVVAPTLALTSKLNSDATGMRYQWGRKDPFTYATSSESRGSGNNECGKYPVKIYTIDGVLIYQVDNGTSNTGKAPLGGVISQSSVASSMMVTIANPITFYYGWGGVINQAGHSKDLYNYYWTSYSRGTDGRHNPNEPSWHNVYLDGYIPLRAKSIYDPCPYLYRIPSNGTWNQFTSNPGWTINSYLGGVSWNMTTLPGASWFAGLGWRSSGSNTIGYTGYELYYRTATPVSQTQTYTLWFTHSNTITPNRGDRPHSDGLSVRCIEDCDPRADGTPASAGVMKETRKLGATLENLLK